MTTCSCIYNGLQFIAKRLRMLRVTSRCRCPCRSARSAWPRSYSQTLWARRSAWSCLPKAACADAHVQTKRACSYRLQGPASWVLAKVLDKKARPLPVGGECYVVDKIQRTRTRMETPRLGRGSLGHNVPVHQSNTHTRAHTRLVDLTSGVSDLIASFCTSMNCPGFGSTVNTSAGSKLSSSSFSWSPITTLYSLLMSPLMLKIYRYSVVHDT